MRERPSLVNFFIDEFDKLIMEVKHNLKFMERGVHLHGPFASCKRKTVIKGVK